MIEKICVLNSKKRKCIQSKYYQDGLCKKEDARLPNQIVCQLGKVFCPDLTCKDANSECPYYLVLTTKVRYVDKFGFQTTISCSNPDVVVCCGGSCVENEIMCKLLKECLDKLPYLW